MKPKTLQKKLVLNKKTVTDLSIGQLSLAKGGIEESVDLCVDPLSDQCATGLQGGRCHFHDHYVTYTCFSCPIPC